MSDMVISKYHDTEISKVDDFNLTAETPISILAALMEGAFIDVVGSFVLSGMSVSQLASPSMNVQLNPGLAFSRAENKILHSAAAVSVAVAVADASLDRLDTVEMRYATQDFDTETRAFKSPSTGAITYSAVNTKTKIFLELRCLEGTPGAGVAPSVESGWMKLAEVSVPAGTTQIINASIVNMTAQEDGAENTTWTADKTASFMLGSVESIKSTILAHIANPITASNSVHGIRQGAGNGLDGDLLDGQHGAFYTNAGNLNAGEIPLARVPTTLVGKIADMVDGYHAGNESGRVPVSNGNLNIDLNSDKLDGEHGAFYRDAGNLNAGLVPLDRIPSTLTGKIADMVDGYHAGNESGKVPISNTALNIDLNSDMLDGQHGAFYRNAENMDAGLLPLARLPATLTGKDADTLDGQHGAYYRDAGNLNAGEIPLARIPATLTGKDVDTLDGQHGAFYQNAGNLNAGLIPLARIPTELTGKNAPTATVAVTGLRIRIGRPSPLVAGDIWIE